MEHDTPGLGGFVCTVTVAIPFGPAPRTSKNRIGGAEVGGEVGVSTGVGAGVAVAGGGLEAGAAGAAGFGTVVGGAEAAVGGIGVGGTFVAVGGAGVTVCGSGIAVAANDGSAARSEPRPSSGHLPSTLRSPVTQ